MTSWTHNVNTNCLMQDRIARLCFPYLCNKIIQSIIVTTISVRVIKMYHARRTQCPIRCAEIREIILLGHIRSKMIWMCYSEEYTSVDNDQLWLTTSNNLNVISIKWLSHWKQMEYFRRHFQLNPCTPDRNHFFVEELYGFLCETCSLESSDVSQPLFNCLLWANIIFSLFSQVQRWGS